MDRHEIVKISDWFSKIVENRYGKFGNRFASCCICYETVEGSLWDRSGSLWVVIGSLRIVLEFLGIALGHYGIFPNLFDIFSGPLNFVKNRHGILVMSLDGYGSLVKLLKIAMESLRVVEARYGIFKD